MQKIRVTVALDCPEAVAEKLLPQYFALRRDRLGAIRMPIHLPLADFGLPVGLAVSHDVDVLVAPGRDEQNLNDVYRIRWTPAGGGPFPELDGTLTLYCERVDENAYLEFDGTYEPPLGNVVGEAFDAALGYLIAQRSAQKFVEDIADGLSGLRTATTA